jgi:GrpB-like predicted nucleotidyltransferase (UPF0157 family)
LDIFERKVQLEDSLPEKASNKEQAEFDSVKRILDDQLTEEINYFRDKREEQLIKFIQEFLRNKFGINKILLEY